MNPEGWVTKHYPQQLEKIPYLRTATQRRTVVSRADPRSSAAVFSSRDTAGRSSWYRSVPVSRWIACAPRTAAEPIVVPAHHGAPPLKEL